MEKIIKEIDFGSPKILKPISVDLIAENRPDVELRMKLLASFQAALKESSKGQLEGDAVENFFGDLTGFLESDPNNARVLLYLPFEVLPDIKLNRTKNSKKLSGILRDSFIMLLYESEVRASFDDGDELEPGLPEPERTRKAAHLLPFFLERGVISAQDALKLFELSDESELDRSLMEGLIVANDMNLFEPQNWKAVIRLAKKKKIEWLINDVHSEEIARNLKPNLIAETLNASLMDIEKKYSKDSPYVHGISEKRAKWEMSVKIDEAVSVASNNLAELLANGHIAPDEVEEFGFAGMRAIFIAALKLASGDRRRAGIFISEALPVASRLRSVANGYGLEEFRTGINHLVRLNLLTIPFAKALKIDIPDLSQALPINLEDFMQSEGKIFRDITRKIENSPELSKYLFPTILLFGSRIKGYSSQNGDFDLAIFVKPGITKKLREEMLSMLKKEIPELMDIDRVLEFWTNEKDGKLDLRPVPENSSNLVVGFPQIHFIFGGVWIGENRITGKIKDDLKEKYLNLDRFGDQKELMRRNFLRQLELDVLQYRLMHKGYRKFYPPEKPAGTVHSKLIDYRSDFWDSGYRKLATELFLKKVFLPDLTRS